MKTLLMNRAPVEGPWGGGNLFVRAIVKYGPEFGYRVIHHFETKVDAILMVDPRPDGLGIGINEIMRYKARYSNVKVVHRINECDARKGTSDMDQMLRLTSSISDASVFISEWLRDHHVGNWGCNNTHVGYSGVDKEHFYPREKFNDGRIHLVTHHWSNNDLKGFDIYHDLDGWIKNNPEFTFTYIGRDQGKFKNTRVFKPLFGKALGDELGKYDVAISGTRFDPAPNHIIEEMASGMPTYVHHDGGGAVELAGKDHEFYSFGALTRLLLDKKFESNTNGVEIGGWKACAQKYLEIVDSVLD